MNESTARTYKMLIIDDEQFVRDILQDLFSERFECRTAASAAQALEHIENEKFSIVLSDIDLGGMSGIEVVPRILKRSPDTVVVMISGNQTIDVAIQAMRVGAFDYIRKPFEIDFVELAVKRAFDHHKLLAGKRLYEEQLENLVRQRTDQLNHLAYHDPLTDLPNRILFRDRLEQAMITARSDEEVILIRLAIDGFQKLQDALGHARADKILSEAAGRLAAAIDDDVTLARIESGEFGLLLAGTGGERDIAAFVEDLQSALQPPIASDENEIFLTASVGISCFPADAADPDKLIKNTSAALLQAREDGGGSYQFYSDGMNAEAERRLAMEQNLRRAVERGEFELHYQPKVDAESRRITGVEALVRWRHPELGMISPAEFIPLAEETGVIVPLGEWVLREACEATRRLNERGFDISVAVNFSLRQLHQDLLVEKVQQTLEQTGLSGSFLNLEITESSLMRDMNAAMETLTDLRDLGIRISLDDFGTGYSSFGHLKRLPIDVLKIDKSFIRDVTTDPDDASLTMAMISLAHNLRLRVVAEGVETEDQVRFLDLLRCDEYQGYFFSRPVPLDDLIILLGGRDQNAGSARTADA